MEIKLITSNKKQFLDLLLLADEQESMIDKYLERGEMFALYDDGLKAISVVTCEGEGIYEIKNIAVCPSLQFEEGIEKTVRWYLENNEWMENIASGEYNKYYESMYKI